MTTFLIDSYKYLYKAGVGKLRPAGQLRPAKGKSAAREHVSFLKEMRPEKQKYFYVNFFLVIFS